MKRKVLIMMMAACMVFGLSACGGDAGKDTKKEEQSGEEKPGKEEEEVQTKVDAINLETEEGSLVYTSHELTQDYEGNNAVRIYFTYTNKSEDAKLVQFAFRTQVFQNGVECEMTTGDFMNPNEADQNAIKEVMNGGSLNVAFLYAVPDPAAPILLKVSDMSNLLDDVYQEQDINL